MQIGEVAKLTAISVDAIRFYERQFLLPKAPRTSGRFRIFARADIARLTFIKQMQGLGFSLNEVRQLMDLREQSVEACIEVHDLLSAKLNNVRSKIRELTQLERQLMVDLRKCNCELKERKTRQPKTCPVLKNGHGKTT